MKPINSSPHITARAIKFLAAWALEQLPPLQVIAACDRALWWANRVGTCEECGCKGDACDDCYFNEDLTK